MRPLAEELTQEVLSQHFDVCSELAECHCALGQYREAESCYREAGDLCPQRPEPHVGLGTLYLQMDLLRDAEREFERALGLDAASSGALNGLAAICMRKGDAPKAFEYYIRSLEADCDNLLAILGLFRTSCLMGSFSRVIHYLLVYLDMHPGDISVMYCLATLYVKEDRLADCRELLYRILALDPENSEALALLAEAEQGLRKERSKAANATRA